MTSAQHEDVCGQTRVEDLAGQAEGIMSDIITAVEQCPDAQWSARATGEQRSVGVIAHHVAAVAAFFTETLALAAAGDGGPHLSD